MSKMVSCVSGCCWDVLPVFIFVSGLYSDRCRAKSLGFVIAFWGLLFWEQCSWVTSRCTLSLKAATLSSRSWEVVDHNSVSVVERILVLHVGITKAVRAFWKLRLLFFSVSGRQAAVENFPAQMLEIGCICSHVPISMSKVILTGKTCISYREVCRVATPSYIYPYFVELKRSDLQMLSKQ